MNQAYKRQTNYDGSQINYVIEGMPYALNLSKANIYGAPTTIAAGSSVIAKTQVPIDFLCEQVSFVAFIDNPANPGVNDIIPSASVKTNIRDNLSQESWVFTAGSNLGQGQRVPVSLLFGPKPTQLPSPRAMYEGNMLEVDIEAVDYDIIDFRISFVGRRIDMMPQWERDLVCGDPRTSGAYWIYFSPQNLVRGDSAANPLNPGNNHDSFLRIPTLPFDIIVTSWSGFVTASSNSASPIARAWFDFSLSDMNNSKLIAYNFIPSFILGGTTLNSNVTPPAASVPLDTVQLLEYAPRSMPLNTAWTIRQTSSIGCTMRAIYSPLDVDDYPTMTAQLMLHGSRVPSSEIAVGYPYYNRNSADQRCPSDVNPIPGGQVALNQKTFDQSNPGASCNMQNQSLGGFTESGGYQGAGVYVNNMGFPSSMPYPAPVLNNHGVVPVRNPNQEGGQVLMPNRGQERNGWGYPGYPQDGRGPRFKNV